MSCSKALAAKIQSDGADFRASLQSVFDEAKAKQFHTIMDIKIIVTNIVDFWALCRITSSAQARASWPVRLPDGNPVDSHVALPPRTLYLSAETQSRLREACADKEFIGILLAAQLEQMTRPVSSENNNSATKRKRRGRDVRSSPKEKTPVMKKVRRHEAVKKAQVPSPPSSPSTCMEKRAFDEAALLKTQKQSKSLQLQTFPDDAGHGPFSRHAGLAKPPLSVDISSDGETELTPKSGRRARDPVKNSTENTAAKRGYDSRKPSYVDAKTNLVDRTQLNGKSPQSGGNPTVHKDGFSNKNCARGAGGVEKTFPAATSMTLFPRSRVVVDKTLHSRVSPGPRTATRLHNPTEDSESFLVDSGDDDGSHMSSSSSPLNIATPQRAAPLTSGQKLAKDIGKVLRKTGASKDDDWADKTALVEWLTVGHQRILKRNGAGPTLTPGPATRLDDIVRHIPIDLEAVSSDKRAGYMAELKRFCNSVTIHNMDYEQRLVKVFDIFYLGEELDAVAKGDWMRLEQILGLCSVIAEGIGPHDEVVDEKTKNRWIVAKKVAIASLKRLMAAKERCQNLGL